MKPYELGDSLSWDAYFFTDPDYVEYGAPWWCSYSSWLVIPEED